MDMALHELPLAIFTTLAPLGAGAFVTLALVFFTKKFSAEEYKKIDILTIVPLLFCLVGLIASFMHLASPMNALNVASTIGSTPLANEITAFGIFCIVAAIYWIVALTGKLTFEARKASSIVVAVLGVIFAIFVGLAYMLPTVVTWNTPLSPVMMIGFFLFGGTLLGMLVLSLATRGNITLSNGEEKAVFWTFTLGALIALVGVIAFFAMASTTTSVFFNVAALSGSLIPCFVFFIVLSVIAYGMGFFAIKLYPSALLLGIAIVLVVIAIFLARLCFYGLQIGIAL